MYHCSLLAHLFIDAVSLLKYLSYTEHKFPCLAMCSNNSLAPKMFKCSMYVLVMKHF